MIPKISFRSSAGIGAVRSTFPQSGIQVARHMFFAEFKQKVDPVVAVVAAAAAAVSGAKIAQG